MLVFGGTDFETGVTNYDDAFAMGFSRERNLFAWAAVGAAPLTRSCLQSNDVIQNTASDPMHVIHQKIEDSNRLACQLLTARGYNGDRLRLNLKTVDVPSSITVPNSKARQEAIAAARHQGTRFYATRGGHLCSDDIFIAMELKKRRGERLLVEKDKASRLAAEKVEKDALKILEGADAEKGKKKLKGDDIRVLLSFYGVEKKAKTAGGMRMQYNELKEKNASPKPYQK